MAEHEPSIGMSDEWFTPPAIFDALGLTFDLDVASPGKGRCWVPARRIYTKQDDGLVRPWTGMVFCNPPYGPRNGHVPWLKRFVAHANGIGVFRAYTSSAWFHELVPLVDLVVFPKGKTKFIRPDGSIGGSPGHGTVLLAMGAVAVQALSGSGLGLIWAPRAPQVPPARWRASPPTATCCGR